MLALYLLFPDWLNVAGLINWWTVSGDMKRYSNKDSSSCFLLQTKASSFRSVLSKNGTIYNMNVSLQFIWHLYIHNPYTGVYIIYIPRHGRFQLNDTFWRINKYKCIHVHRGFFSNNCMTAATHVTGRKTGFLSLLKRGTPEVVLPSFVNPNYWLSPLIV